MKIKTGKVGIIYFTLLEWIPEHSPKFSMCIEGTIYAFSKRYRSSGHHVSPRRSTLCAVRAIGHVQARSETQHKLGKLSSLPTTD